MYQIHKKYLDYLSNNLDILGIGPIETVLVEPEWKNQQNQVMSLCDLIAINSYQAIPIELKQSQVKKEKALKQLHRGVEYIIDELKMIPASKGFFVLYDPKKTLDLNPYYFTQIDLN